MRFRNGVLLVCDNLHPNLSFFKKNTFAVQMTSLGLCCGYLDVQ